MPNDDDDDDDVICEEFDVQYGHPYFIICRFVCSRAVEIIKAHRLLGRRNYVLFQYAQCLPSAHVTQ